MIIEGGVSVKAALLAGRRTVSQIYLDQSRHDKDAAFVLRTAAQKEIPVTRLDRAEIDAMATGRTHGGLLAEVQPRQLQTLADCLQADQPFLVLLEGVEDPFNLGYVMRSLYCAGCSGLLLRSRSWQSAESTVLRASAGASEYLNTVMCEDPAAAVRQCAQQGLCCYAAMRKDAIPYDQADFRQPFLLAIGGEMRGLSAAVLQQTSQNLYIPYANEFRNALNAAGAAAVLSFEALRQRRQNGI